MSKHLLFILLLQFFILFNVKFETNAQITVTPNITANALVDRLAGSGIVYSNALLTCPNNASGKFSNGLASSVLIDSGIVLTTGRALSSGTAYGVNGNASNFASINNIVNGGDANLATAAGTSSNNIHDLCKLEFDFVPTGDTIQFRYRFGSEEYPEYNCTDYNDIFAFFISGPGYVVPTNVALIPGTNIPVAINTINNGTVNSGNGGVIGNCTSLGIGSPFTSLYVNNSSSTTITYDGLTSLLTAKAAVTPCSTYHMKFAIADLSDHIYDSGVFLEAGSFSSDIASVVSVTSSNSLPSGNPFSMEGCTPAVITIARPIAKPYPQVVNYTLSGTATNGVDVTTLSGSATIPAFATSVTITVNALQDGIVEGTETLIFGINGSLCSNAITETLTMEILEYPHFTKPLNDTICNGLSIALSAIPLPSNPNLSFTWSPGSSLNTTLGSNVIATPLSTTTYTITSSFPGCPAVDSMVTITVDPLPTLVLTKTNVACAGVNNGTITANGSAGLPYLISLNPGSGSGASSPYTFTGLSANTYTVTITSGAGCTKTATATITAPVSMIWSNTQFVNPLCSGTANGSIQVSAAGGAGAISYLLNPGGLSNASGTFNSLIAQMYTVTATDANGCTISTSIALTVSNAIVWTNISQTNITPCNGNSNGTISVTASGGSGTLTYTLNPTGLSNSSGLYSGLNAANYTVQVSDMNGCNNSTAITITQPSALSINSFTPTNILCNGTNLGSISMNVIGGTGPKQYTLLPAGTINSSGVFTNLGVGSYTIIVTDANGCTVSSSTVLTQPSAVQFASFNTTDVLCNGGNTGSIVVLSNGGTGPLTYSLNPGGISGSSGSFLNLSAGVYTVQVSDANGCQIITVASITQPPVLSFSSTNFLPVLCNGANTGSIQTTVTGGSGSYAYTLNPLGISNTTGIFSSLGALSYSVQVTDANGCTILTTINITQPVPLQINSFTTTNILCNGASTGLIQINVNGGTGPKQYSLIPGAFSSTTGNFSNLSAGIYTVLATDANGCTISSITNITQPLPLIFSSFNISNIACNGGNTGSISAQCAGGTGSSYSYQLSPSGLTNTSGSFPNLFAGTYTVQVSDANACTLSSVAIISQQPSLIFSNATLNHVSCYGTNSGGITISASGGSGTINYLLNPGAVSNTTGIFSSLFSGNYTITATDALGCSNSTSLTITQPTLLQIATVAITHPVCANVNNGVITFTANGGSPVYQYAINTGGFSSVNTFTNLAAGSYVLHLKDAKGCIKDSLVTLVSQSNLVFNLINLQQVYCKYDSTGWINLNTSGGIAPYTYLINGMNSVNAGNFQNLIAGNYSIYVVDSFGCDIDTVISITEPSVALNFSNITLQHIRCYGDQTGEISTGALGGTPPYQFALNASPYQPGGSFLNISAGVYSIHLKDFYGCEKDTILTLTQPQSPLVLMLKKYSEITCIGLEDGEIDVLTSGGTQPYTFTINGVSNGGDSIFTNLKAGPYLIEVTDANGCKAVLAYNMPVPTNKPFIVLEEFVQNICKGEQNGAIDWKGMNGYPPFVYTVNAVFIDTLSKLTNLSSGNYFIQLEDFFGCKADTNIFIANLTTLDVNVQAIAASCNGLGNDGKAKAIVNGGMPPYNFVWLGLPPADSLSENIPYGEHQLIVRDAENCLDTANYIISYVPCCDLYMPNAFSPNGDGHNDIFNPITYGILDMKSLEVFDRWGNKIFNSNNNSEGWDGKYKGVDCEIGTYFYLVRYYCRMNQELLMKKGDFVLIK